MATLSDLEEVKEALDKGLVSQAEFDEVKRDYLRGMEECQKLELQAKKEALEANKEFEKRKSEADLRAYALESIVKHGSSIMSEEQKVDLVRDYAKMSGLDRGAKKDAPALKRQRVLAEKRDASPPQPPKPPAAAAAAVLPPADAPTPADEDEYSNYSDGDGEDDSDDDEPRTGKRWKPWTEEDDTALVAALRAGQSARSIRIAGRAAGTSSVHLHSARRNGSGSPALREYLEETCPDYVYKPPSERRVYQPWSAEEDLTFIQAHRDGKTHKEIAAMLPGRTHRAVRGRWSEAKIGKCGTAALRAYAAKCCKG